MIDISTSEIVNRVWNYAHVLRDEGIGYGDYVEQLTYLIFLKMSSEKVGDQKSDESFAAEQWNTLIKLKGKSLESSYSKTLELLGTKDGTLGTIFRKAQNKIQDTEKLEKLIELINKESWFSSRIDVKGAIYEGLLQRGAESEKKGAGQYFTPRAVIEAIVDVMQPHSMQVIADPACGTGGFLTAAYEYIAYKINRDTCEKKKKPLTKVEIEFLENDAFKANDISDSVARLCAMNLYLHGIGIHKCPVSTTDALAKEVGDNKVDMVLANPPFGKKSSVTIISEKSGKLEKEKLTYERTDFWVDTSNKQLNFLQHIANMLKVNGKAAVILPDNVLFEGGAGEVIRKELLFNFDLHTILRLPTGIFYAQGVKANVLFFDAPKKIKKNSTTSTWIYDLRTNTHKTLKQNMLTRSDFDEFVSLFCSADRSLRKSNWAEFVSDDNRTGPKGRWRQYTYDDLISRDKINLDIVWLKDTSLEDSDSLLPPLQLATEIVDLLSAALEEFKNVEEILIESNE